MKVSASGGVPAPVTTPVKGGPLHVFPYFLPDGRHFLFSQSVGSGKGGVYVGSLDDPPTQPGKQVLSTLANVVFTLDSRPGADPNSGYLLFANQSSLLAQRFDTAKLALAGEPVHVATGVLMDAKRFYSYFTASGTGTLAYRNADEFARQQFTWLDREGKSLSTVGDAGTYSEIALSPDGKNLAYTSGGPGATEISVFDLSRKVSTNITFDPGTRAPVWSPDGKKLVYTDSGGNLYIKDSSGATNPELLYKSDEPKTPNDWSRDGRFLLFTSTSTTSQNDLLVLPMTGERKPFPFLATPAQEGIGAFSPEGNFVAYVSNESGKNEIYVRSFPDASGRWKVSKTGVDPRWSRDGRKLFYILGTTFMSVDVATKPTFQLGTPEMLFTVPVVQAGNWARNNAYDVAADNRFIATIALEQKSPSAINVVLNWMPH
jgi:dipeptidyl aminopeptidase/acylaminoacyl peptidase